MTDSNNLDLDALERKVATQPGGSAALRVDDLRNDVRALIERVRTAEAENAAIRDFDSKLFLEKAQRIATLEAELAACRKAGKGFDALIVKASPRPWHVSFEAGHHGTPGEPDEAAYCEGIMDANNNWVVRFDDDYGTDQWADADLIVALVNSTISALAELDKQG